MSGGQVQAGAETLWSVSAGIDRALRAFVDRQPVGDFYELVRYHLGWMAEGAGVLRPRAVLCVIACQACGGTFEQALPGAIAIALLHGFELNQEDLERQRRSRHGRQSVWTLWGRPQAMNAGDGMHALAKMALLDGRQGLPAGAIMELEEALDESCLRCCEAIDAEQATTDTADLLELAAAKGAVLFGCAAYAGCLLATAGGAAPLPDAAAMRRFGELLGSAAGVRPLDAARSEELRRQAFEALAAASLPTEHESALRGLASYVLRGD